MSMQFKPDGFTSVSPYLIVSDAGKTIDFLVHGLGAGEIRRITSPEGRVLHAEVRLDDSVIMLSDSAEGWPAVAAHVHVYVPDVDMAYSQAVAHGAESVQEPVQKDDEDKRGAVRDSGGTTWWLATRVGL